MSLPVSRAWLLATTVLGLLLFTAPAAQAHKVTLFAWVEDGQVHTESKFSGGKRVKEGKIEVFDHQDNKVLEGISDDQGYFAFPIPEGARKLKIIMVAGMGHSNHWVVSAQELGAATTAPPGTAQTPTTVAQAVTPNPSGDPVQLDVAVVQQIVDKALDKKLAPLKAQIAEQAWGVRDIVGGIGYIIGLMGLASYLRYRKQQRPNPNP